MTLALIDTHSSPWVGKGAESRTRPRSIFPSCSRCAGRMTAEDRHYYGDHCEDCARRESDAWDIIRRES